MSSAKRILLVDDDEPFRTMLHKTLRTAGYDVQDAANGEAALNLYDPASFDVILIDLVMPEKEGIETITELRRTYPTAKIIAMSGGGRIDPRITLRAASKLGARRTLTKPFPKQFLLGLIAEVLAEAA